MKTVTPDQLREAGYVLADVIPVLGDESPNGHTPEGHARTIRAADVEPERIEWLWAGRVPYAMLTVLGGMPNVGKSTILYDLAAKTSREGKAVLILTAEDHLASVVRPRLEAAEAELELVHLVTVPMNLPDDVAMLEAIIREHDVALVTLDPLVAFVIDSTNTHRDHHVRRVLAPLGAIAERTGVAFVVVIHTNKGQGSDPMLRISGSIGFVGAARSLLVAAPHPNDEDRRVLATPKSNYAEMPVALAYRVVGVTQAGGIETSKVEWLGECPEVDADDLLSHRDSEERSVFADAVEFLRESNVLEQEHPAGPLVKEAKAAGLSEPTLHRARRFLGVASWRAAGGLSSGWIWGPRRLKPRPHWEGLATVDSPPDSEGFNEAAHEDFTPTLEILKSSAPPAETEPDPTEISRIHGLKPSPSEPVPSTPVSGPETRPEPKPHRRREQDPWEGMDATRRHPSEPVPTPSEGSWRDVQEAAGEDPQTDAVSPAEALAILEGGRDD